MWKMQLNQTFVFKCVAAQTSLMAPARGPFKAYISIRASQNAPDFCQSKCFQIITVYVLATSNDILPIPSDPLKSIYTNMTSPRYICSAFVS